MSAWHRFGRRLLAVEMGAGILGLGVSAAGLALVDFLLYSPSLVGLVVVMLAAFWGVAYLVHAALPLAYEVWP